MCGKKWVILMFMGEFHHNIDDKGRIVIPSKFREGLGYDFIITRGLDGCLFIYPKSEWNNVINKYKELPDTRDKRQFMRIFLSGATSGEYDKQFRINIPRPLQDYAKLEHECVIIGVDERLELWSKEIWESFITSNEESLSAIADNLFTTIN